MIGKIVLAVQASLCCFVVIFTFVACSSTSSGLVIKPTTKPKPEYDFEPGYQAVSALIAMGNQDQAVALYEKEFAAHPDSPKTQALYANLLLGAGQVEKARDVLGPLAAANPENADVQFSYSLVASLGGDRKTQLQALNQTLRIDPDHSGALSARGELELQAKQFSDAEHSFDRSLKKDPENYVAVLGKAAVLSRTNRMDEAQIFLNKAVRMQPGFSFAWSDRARVEAERGDFVTAETDMDKAISLEPEYAFHYLDRGRILARAGKQDAAIADFSKVLEMEPKLFLVRSYRGQIYQERGDWAAAKADFEVVVTQKPNFYPAYEPLALAAWKTGDWNSAVQWFEKSYDPQLENEGALMLAALALFESGEKPALKAYATRIETKLKRDGLNWQILRFLQDPVQEALSVDQVSVCKDAVEKAKASLGLAIGLLKAGRQQTGVLFLQNVIDFLPASTAERQIATWILDEYKR